MFDEAAPTYQEALNRAGYKHKLEYTENVENPARRKRKRDVIYFNPPFNMNVETNIGKEFLKLVDSSFPAGNPLHGKLNRHNIKLSYSTMPNMGAQIKRHNQRLLKGDTVEELEPCPHTRGVPCPMPGTGECTKTNVVYQATVTSDDGQVNTYIGGTNNFRVRYYAHRSDANNPSRKEKGTTLSKYIWNLKEERKDFQIKWRFVDRGAPYNPISRVCRLCVKESYYLIFHREMSSINKRNEIFNVCKHRFTDLLMKS